MLLETCACSFRVPNGFKLTEAIFKCLLTFRLWKSRSFDEMSLEKKSKIKLEPLSKLISLKSKKALITGSGAGIGKAIAYRFAEAGADLELVDINVGSLDAVRKELEQFDVEVNIHKVDLSEKEEIDVLWTTTLKGKEPDILVNNAGIYPSKPFLDVNPAFLKRVMDVNLNSAFWMCPHMIRGRLKKGSYHKHRFNRSYNASEGGIVSI